MSRRATRPLQPILDVAHARREQAEANERIAASLLAEAATQRADAARLEELVARVADPAEKERKQTLRVLGEFAGDVREVRTA